MLYPSSHPSDFSRAFLTAWKWPICWLLVLLALLPTMLGKGWTPNELDYFGQAAHFLATAPGEAHYAASKAELFRGVFVGATHVLIELVGLDRAWAVERVLAWMTLSAALVSLCLAWQLSRLAAVAALLVFLTRQTYFGGEWVFGGAESKVFAYVLVLVGLACSARKQTAWAVLALIGATYLHFLVGGFWALAIGALVGLQERSWRTSLRAWGLPYALAVMPLVMVLAWQEWGATSPATQLVVNGLTASQIYANVRNPHHIAPFLDGRWHWPASGLLLMGLSTMALWWGRGMTVAGPVRVRLTWLLCLHGYLFLALILAWFDRDTQLLGKFYLFRPAALIWLLTLLVCADLALTRMQRGHVVAYKVVALLVLVSVAGSAVRGLSHIRVGGRLVDVLHADERELLSWVHTHTSPSDTILIEEGYSGPGLNALDFEQLAHRPTLVNWKFVPTTEGEILRWYRLNLLKRAAFAGDCAAVQGLAVYIYITRTPHAAEALAACGARQVFASGEWRVLRAVN